MFVPPPPDPYEYRDPPRLTLSAPVAVFLCDPPTVAADHLAASVLEWRPGALVVVDR